MLIFSGTLPNGETVYEKPFPAKEVMNIFQVPEMGALVEFLVDARFSKRDTETGDVRHPRAFAFSPTYTLNHNAGTVSVRYADSRTPTAGGKDFTYLLSGDGASTGKLHDLRGSGMFFNQPSQVEKYIFYYLHPLNGTNPYRDPRKEVYFNFVNREAEAKVRLAAQLEISAIEAQILDSEISALRIIAAGLEYKVDGMTIKMSNLDTIQDTALRLQMIDRLRANPKEFIKAWQSGNTTLTGMISRAIDKNFIKKQTYPGGAAFQWNLDSNEAVIVAVSGNEDELTALRTTFTNHYEQLFPILKNALDSDRLANMTLPSVPVLEDAAALTVQALMSKGWDYNVDQGLIKGVIAYDFNTNMVRFVKDGVLAGDLFQPASPINWRNELVDHLKSAPGAPLRMAVVNAVHDALTANVAAEQVEELDLGA